MAEQEIIGPHSMYTVLGMTKQAIDDSNLTACRQMKEYLSRNSNLPTSFSVNNGHTTMVIVIRDQIEKTVVLEAVSTRIKSLELKAE